VSLQLGSFGCPVAHISALDPACEAAMEQQPKPTSGPNLSRAPKLPISANANKPKAQVKRPLANDRPSWERPREPGAPGAMPMQDPAQQRMPYRPVEATPEEKSGATGWGQVGLGALMAGGGTVATVASYSAASPGGRYTVLYGLIVVGIITIVKGLATLGGK
jgi:hypothetical protein